MLKRFLQDESGAVTVEWVVMTAASVGLGLAVINVVSNGVEAASVRVSDFLEAVELNDSFDDWTAFRTARAEAPDDTPDP